MSVARFIADRAVASRGGIAAVNGPNWREDQPQRVIFHTDCGST